MDAGEMLDRYVHEVGRHLPKGERADVRAELRALLEETLVDRAQVAGSAPDEGIASEVLREFGRPRAVAERYGGSRSSLIGPAYFPAFVTTTQVIVAVFAAIYVVANLWALGAAERSPAEQAATLFESAIELGLMALANIGLMTLIFAAIERMAPSGESEEEDWDPRELPAVEDPDRVARSDILLELGFDIGGLAVFTFLVRFQSPFIMLPAGTPVGRFTPEFMAYVPWLYAVGLLAAAVHLAVFLQGRWRQAIRLADAAVGGATTVVLFLIITGGQLVDIAGLGVVVKMGLAVILAIVLFETGAQLVRLARGVQRQRAGSEPRWT